MKMNTTPRLLLVGLTAVVGLFTQRGCGGDSVRIISARLANRRERRTYANL